MNSTSKTDWARIDAMTDEEIDTSDSPPLGDDFFRRAKFRSERKASLEKQLTDAAKDANGLSGYLLTFSKIVLSCIPAASPLVTALDEFLPNAHSRTQKRALELLVGQLKVLEDRIEYENVKTDEFVDLFKNCYFVQQRTQFEEKIAAANAILVNALLRQSDQLKLPFQELDHFVRCVEQLSLGALKVLSISIQVAGPPNGRNPSCKAEEENVRFDFAQLQSLLPNMDPDLMMGLVGELSRFNLLHTPTTPSVRYQGNKYANYPLETTPLGFRFVTYIVNCPSSK